MASQENELPYLLLDIDGVLNRCGASGQGLELDKMVLLKHILDSAPCRVIISSSWRKTTENLHRIIKAMLEIGHKPVGMTPILDGVGVFARRPSRGEEIEAWLALNSPVEHFVILDDDKDGMEQNLFPHLVWTNSFQGLTPVLAEETIRRLKKQGP